MDPRTVAVYQSKAAFTPLDTTVLVHAEVYEAVDNVSFEV